MQVPLGQLLALVQGLHMPVTVLPVVVPLVPLVLEVTPVLLVTPEVGPLA
jgi:hypothetical protein